MPVRRALVRSRSGRRALAWHPRRQHSARQTVPRPKCGRLHLYACNSGVCGCAHPRKHTQRHAMRALRVRRPQPCITFEVHKTRNANERGGSTHHSRPVAREKGYMARACMRTCAKRQKANSIRSNERGRAKLCCAQTFYADPRSPAQARTRLTKQSAYS